MDYDLSPAAPSWVDFAPNSLRGLDLLGLRLPVQAIGLSLLNAVTTIAPKVRYLSFRTFIADAYRTAPGPPPDSYDAFMSFALPAEVAFAMGNTLVAPDATNIVGIGKASELLETEGDLIALEKLVAQPALNIYGQPAATLGLVGTGDGAPWIGKDVGHRLAQELRESWGSTTLGRRLLEGETLDAANREDLKEFGEACSVNKLLEEERRLLIDAIIPESPNRDAVERVRTCALLLYLSRYRYTEGSNGLVTEAELMSAARQPGPSFPEVLRRALDGWLLYQVRDCLAVVHEAALGEVVSFLNSAGHSPGGVLGQRGRGRAVELRVRVQPSVDRPRASWNTRKPRRYPNRGLGEDCGARHARTGLWSPEVFGDGMGSSTNGSSLRRGGAMVAGSCCCFRWRGSCQICGRDGAYGRKGLSSTGSPLGEVVVWE